MVAEKLKIAVVAEDLKRLIPIHNEPRIHMSVSCLPLSSHQGEYVMTGPCEWPDH